MKGLLRRYFAWDVLAATGTTPNLVILAFLSIMREALAAGNSTLPSLIKNSTGSPSNTSSASSSLTIIDATVTALLDSNNSGMPLLDGSGTDLTETEEPIHLYHMHDAKNKPQRIKFFETQFSHVQTQLTFAFWFFMITIAKIVFQRFQNVKGVLPDSALLIVLGSIFGGIFHFVFPDEEIYLQPDWFFLYFLPPIALDAGYFMPNKEFFQNIGTITTYAVVGTLFNITAIGLTLFVFRDFFTGTPPAIDLLVFATLISAVDPVAVICVFEEVHVNQVLFICVFGESLLNDAVTIVLYHTLNAISEVGTNSVIWSDYIFAILSFLWVSLGGILVGFLWAILTGIATKWSVTVTVVQPLICLLFPYVSYLCAESLGLSGILAIVVCGMLMKQYVIVNISDNSKVTVDYFMKTLSSSCEAVIFVFLGLSAVSKNHVFDFTFIIVTLVSCLLYRFIGVGIMTYLLNMKRMQKINFVDQFIMGYGGIRGAVCYGLVMSLSIDIVTGKHMFATTTIIVILFTVFIQGGTIKKLVTYLKVKQHEVYKKSVFEMIADNLINHSTGGMESIVGLHGEYWLRMTIERFNDTYIKPIIMVKKEARGMKIVKHNEEIQVGEAVNYLKQHGSFAGMPTVQSKADLQPPQPRSSLSVPHFYMGMNGSGQVQPQVHHKNSLPPMFTVGGATAINGGINNFCNSCGSTNSLQRRMSLNNPVRLQQQARNSLTNNNLYTQQQQRQFQLDQQQQQTSFYQQLPQRNQQQLLRPQQQRGGPIPLQIDVNASNYDSIPRNQSISGFVRDKFAEVNSPGPMYSRHYLHGDAMGRNFFLFGNNTVLDDGKDDLLVDESENYKTYPYSKSSQKDLLILNIRKASRSNSGAQAFPQSSAPPVTTSFGGFSINNGNGNGNASLYSSPIKEGKPKFMITSDFDSTSDDYNQPSGGNHYYYNDHIQMPLLLPTSAATAVTVVVSSAAPITTNPTTNGNGSSYSIGRFEVGSDPAVSASHLFNSQTSGTPLPCRKLSAGQRRGGLGNDENACPLLPIEEQDEQYNTVHSIRGGSAPAVATTTSGTGEFSARNRTDSQKSSSSNGSNNNIVTTIHQPQSIQKQQPQRKTSH